ncbi:hypothetical protein SESBI_16269 [Sesbania bispinosa]|nr:hypothetical protein SESBI_16269 [Sesbania bispinosa]
MNLNDPQVFGSNIHTKEINESELNTSMMVSKRGTPIANSSLIQKDKQYTRKVATEINIVFGWNSNGVGFSGHLIWRKARSTKKIKATWACTGLFSTVVMLLTRIVKMLMVISLKEGAKVGLGCLTRSAIYVN